MNVTTRAAAHLAVLGFGLVSAALHPAAAGASATASVPATSHVNPAVVRVSFAAEPTALSQRGPKAPRRRQRRHQATPAGRPHHEGRVQASGRPRPAGRPLHPPPPNATGPTQWPAR